MNSVVEWSLLGQWKKLECTMSVDPTQIFAVRDYPEDNVMVVQHLQPAAVLAGVFWLLMVALLRGFPWQSYSFVSDDSILTWPKQNVPACTTDRSQNTTI
jgi:hypothetical protein